MHLLRLTYTTCMPFILLAAAVLPRGVAANGSAIARNAFAGFRVLPDEMAYEFKKRQDTTTPSPAPPSTPVAPPTAPPATTPVAPPSEPSSPPTPSNQGSPSVADPSPQPPTTPVAAPPTTPVAPSPPTTTPDVPSPNPVVPSPPTTTPDVVTPVPPTSTSIVVPSSPPSPPSSPSTVVPDTTTTTPADTPPSSSSAQVPTSISSAVITDIPSPTSPGGSTIVETTALGGSTVVSNPASPPGSESLTSALSSTTLNTDPAITTTATTSNSIGDGTATATSTTSTSFGFLPPTGSDSISSGGSSTPSDMGSPSVPSTTSTVSYSLSYDYATVTVSGQESISISSASISAGYVPVAGPAPIAAPLAVQEVLPGVPNPECEFNYLPADVWETSGTSAPPPTTGNGNGNGTTTTTRPPVISQCNNGTKVSNHVGSAIRLKFTGTEVSLLMVPGAMGGDYDVKLDDEDLISLSNYKPGANDCQIAVPWSRSNLPNKPHEITVIVKGNPAGAAAGGANVEFNGLIFKGPKTETASGPGLPIIIGATVGGVVVIAVLVAIAVVCIRRRRAARQVVPDTRPVTLGSPEFRPQTVMSAHSGHTRADSNFSAAPSNYNPFHQPQQDGAGGSYYGPVLGHTRQQSDAPLMGMVQGQQPPWQPGSSVTYSIPPGAAIPAPMGSPHSRPMNVGGYGNGQDNRTSFAPSHGRTTSYGSDGRNPFE